MVSTILVATDCSSHAVQAVKMAVNLGRALHARVLVLHVFDTSYPAPAEMGAWEWAIGQGAFTEMVAAEREQVEKIAGGILKDSGVDYKLVHAVGHPVQQILDRAIQENVDMIVVGSRGAGGWQAVLLGSVADGVMHQASRPVLVVRNPAEQVKVVLVATDGSECAHKAAAMASDLARAAGAELYGVHVLVPTRGRSSASSAETEAFDSKVYDSIECGFKAAAGNSSCHMERVTGHPAQAITQYAEKIGADIIVLGSRGLGPFKSLLVGSVSDTVAHHSNSSVLIVR